MGGKASRSQKGAAILAQLATKLLKGKNGPIYLIFISLFIALALYFFIASAGGQPNAPVVGKGESPAWEEGNGIERANTGSQTGRQTVPEGSQPSSSGGATSLFDTPFWQAGRGSKGGGPVSRKNRDYSAASLSQPKLLKQSRAKSLGTLRSKPAISQLLSEERLQSAEPNDAPDDAPNEEPVDEPNNEPNEAPALQANREGEASRKEQTETGRASPKIEQRPPESTSQGEASQTPQPTHTPQGEASQEETEAPEEPEAPEELIPPKESELPEAPGSPEDPEAPEATESLESQGDSGGATPEVPETPEATE